MGEIGHVVVEIGESDAVLCAHRLADNDLVDVVELVPILVLRISILD